jgi:DNA-binding transcriptional regulator PaaX
VSETNDGHRRWLVLLARMPAEPARYRMALWRDLRRSSAVLLGQSAWAVPDVPVARALVERVAKLVEDAGGTLTVLAATGYSGADADRLEQLYLEAREDEWSEFRADCEKYRAELEKEETQGKYTLAELEEEDQSLERLRRWYRELRSRDLLGAAAITTATTGLKACEERFELYAEHVYAALSDPRH